MPFFRTVPWISLLLAAADVADVAEECRDSSCPARNTGSTFLQFASRVRHTENFTKLSCAPFSEWPDIDGGVTCGNCQALVVKTDSTKRCDAYRASFGHTCVAAAEEKDENCEIKESYGCDEEIEDTSDMLCTCSRAASPCYTALDGKKVNDEGNTVGLTRTSSMSECEKACSEQDNCNSFTLCPHWNKCWLKDKTLDGTEGAEEHPKCTTVFKSSCSGNTGGGGSGGGGGSSGGGSGGELEVQVVSYNLYWWNAFDQNSWKSDGIIENIKKNLRPDTIGFQECDSPNQIARRTGRLMKASDFKGAQGIMIRQGRFVGSNAGSRDLQATGKWGPRYVTWVKLTDESTGKFFWHFNTHWCVHSQGNRVCNEDVRYRGAKNMVQAIRDVAGDSPVVITGDFNARMREKGPRHFLDSGFKLAVNDWVDCIFYSNHWTLLSEGKGRPAGSDHKPVFAKLALK